MYIKQIERARQKEREFSELPFPFCQTERQMLFQNEEDEIFYTGFLLYCTFIKIHLLFITTTNTSGLTKKAQSEKAGKWKLYKKIKHKAEKEKYKQ